MKIVKKTISLPEELFEEARGLSGNFSGLVEIALREYLHRSRVAKALESFGQWQPRKEDSAAIVNDLRKEESRRGSLHLELVDH